MFKILGLLLKLVRLLFRFFLWGILALFLVNLWVILSTQNRIYDSVAEIPKNRVGLVLGTSKWVAGGRNNLYFTYRTRAAYDLYKAGKVECLLVSGDNGHQSYNEPRDMHDALIKLGVPESDIALDYAGFRTFDSVVRSKIVFQQEKITIISQPFHNYRAVFVANHYDMDAVAFNAKSPHVSEKLTYREYFARAKAFLDLYILRTKPKFLGKKEYICQ